MKTEIVCVGTAVIDILASAIPERDAWKEKQRIGQITMTVGGDAANQSIRLADEGMKVMLVASTGADANGLFLKSVLKERNVDTKCMVVDGLYPTGTALVLVNQKGERNTFSVKGAHSMIRKEHLPELKTLKAEGVRAISIGSLFSLPELEKDGLEEYLRQAKEYDILTFADLGSDKLGQGLEGIRRFLPYIDYFLPSDYDAFQMTGAKEVWKAAEVFLKEGCGTVIVKCGEKGCYIAGHGDDRNESQNGVYIPARKVKTVDTTGAGDCMAALLITRILKGDNLADACRYACAGATLSTLYTGASVQKLSEEEIEKYL